MRLLVRRQDGQVCPFAHREVEKAIRAGAPGAAPWQVTLMLGEVGAQALAWAEEHSDQLVLGVEVIEQILRTVLTSRDGEIP